jgi:hypothetical protein
LLDAQKAAGKLRTANVLLADLKQMLDFTGGPQRTTCDLLAIAQTEAQ